MGNAKIYLKKVLTILRLFINKGTLFYSLHLVVFLSMLILIVMSTWASICIIKNCSNYTSSFNLSGLLFFINQFKDVFGLLGSTLILITLFIGIERINLMSEANELKANETWKKDFKINLDKMKTENVYMNVYFEQIADKIYRYLYKRNFVIHNRIMLRYFIWKYIERQIEHFEKSSKKYIENGERYTSDDEVCSINEIKEIIAFIFRLSPHYKKLPTDFDKIYKSKVKPFAIKSIELNKEKKE